MSQVVTELVIDSNTAGAADYERAMAGAEQAARRGTDAANDFNINVVAISAGAIAAGYAIKKVIDQVVDANKSLADMAALGERVGLSLRDLQGVQLGGQIAGLTESQINSGLEKSAQLLNDAQRNVNSLSKEFEANGLSIRNSNGQLISQNQLLQISADLIKRAQSPQDAIAIAQMLGYTKEWVPFLKQGAETMRSLGDEAQKAGAIIDDDTVQRASEFDRQWRKSSVEWSAYMKSAVLSWLPVIDDAIERAGKFLKSIDRKSVEDAVDKQLKALSDPVGLPQAGGLKFDITPEASDAIRDFGNSSKSIWEQISAVAAGLRNSVQYISEADVKWHAGTGEGVKDTSNWMDQGRWQGQAASWTAMSKTFLEGADNVAGGFSKVAGRSIDANDAVDRAINTLRRHTEQQLADAAAMGQGVGVQAAFRAQAAETAAVQANQGKETAEQARQFAVLRAAAVDAALALERAKVAQSVRFGLSTGFLSQGDVAIAQQLKGIYPDVAAALGSVEAKGLRAASTFREISSAIETNLTTGLTDVLMGTKSVSQGFTDMGLAIVKAIDQAIIKILIVEPLMRSLQASISGSGILSFLGGSSGGTAASNSAKDFAAGGFHGGGIVGGEATFHRNIDLGLFAGARRMHGGGIAGDEVPIIARRGEGVFTPAQMAAMGGAGNVTVNVTNAPADTSANVSTRRGSNGDLQIDVMLDSLVARKMVTPGSASNRVLTDHLGGTQQIASR